jgi:NADH dehydrogenase
MLIFNVPRLITTRSACVASRTLRANNEHIFRLNNLKQFNFVNSRRQFSYSPKINFPLTDSSSNSIHKLSIVKRSFKFFFLSCGIVSGSFLLALTGFFIYDYTTYTPPSVPDNLLIPFDSLNPPIGGPEKLPILTKNLDCYDTDSKRKDSLKKKLVILGCGWGCVSLLNQLNKDEYDVTVISPTNYFLFTPMLPCAVVGTLDVKTLMESIRSLINKVNGHFLHAKAEKIEFTDKLIKVKDCKSNKYFYVPYDKLVVAVGSTSNTHGVKGLEYTYQLKTAEDASTIRKKLLNNFEQACLPTTSDDERKKLLSFVICGAGPTGVEVAAEIFDLVNEDLPRLYPKILRQEVSIHIIQSRSHILNTYDSAISEYAMERFKNDNIDLLVNSRVEEILPDKVIFNQKNENGIAESKEVSYGLCLWSTGIGLNALTKQLSDDLKPFQKNRRALETDAHLRVIGAPLGDIYAIGDCSTVRTDIGDHLEDYVRQFIIKNQKSYLNLKNLGGHEIITDADIKNFEITYPQLQDLSREIEKHNPLAKEALLLTEELIPKYDKSKTGTLKFKDLKLLFKEVDSKVTSLPATAQRAHQEGSYLGKKLTKLANIDQSLVEYQIYNGDIDDAVFKPFKYKHLGSLAYLGNSAVFDLPGHSLFGGLVAMYLWRSIYFAQSVSIRTRVLMFFDWLKRGIFGRDIITE